MSEMTTAQKVVLPIFRCLRCKPPHEWYPRTPFRPTVCPKCKNPYYDKPRVKRNRKKG